MAGTAQGKSLIHTAACLIIGDEVLGGKVRTVLVHYETSRKRVPIVRIIS
jgi:hypothetical protein